jgi:hypothetical protein
MSTAAVPRPGRRIPDTWFRASPVSSTMVFLHSRNRSEVATPPGCRRLGWFILPPFQRPPVWTLDQKIRFVESAWMGLPLGEYIWNDAMGTPYDQWLLDGQQRITALYEYMADGFPVYGHLFSELGVVDHRIWDMTTAFPSLKTNLRDEALLRDVYDRLAYGGTPHEPKA